jgi:hypothetical protein
MAPGASADLRPGERRGDALAAAAGSVLRVFCMAFPRVERSHIVPNT